MNNKTQQTNEQEELRDLDVPAEQAEGVKGGQSNVIWQYPRGEDGVRDRPGGQVATSEVFELNT